MLLNTAKLFFLKTLRQIFFPVKTDCLVFSDQSKVLEVFAQEFYFNVVMYYWGGG